MQAKDVIVTSGLNPTGLKAFIRIGDPTPSTHLTGSSIEFLQDLSTTASSFDTAGTTSAFRIRHDTVGGYLVFEGRSGSNGPFQLMTLNDDTNTVTFGGVVSFDDINFDVITGSWLYIGSGSFLNGTTSITGSAGSASLYIDPTGNFSINSSAGGSGLQITDGLLILGDTTTASLQYTSGDYANFNRGLSVSALHLPGFSDYQFVETVNGVLQSSGWAASDFCSLLGTSNSVFIINLGAVGTTPALLWLYSPTYSDYATFIYSNNKLILINKPISIADGGNVTSSFGGTTSMYNLNVLYINGTASSNFGGNSWQVVSRSATTLSANTSYTIPIPSGKTITTWDYFSLYINGDKQMTYSAALYPDGDYILASSTQIQFKMPIPIGAYLTYAYTG